MLRALDERLVEPRLERIGAVDDGLHVVGDHRREHPAEEPPGRFEPGDDIASGLTVAEPHEAVARHHRREHQRPQIPQATRLRVGDAAELAEVDLQLVARFTIGNARRRNAHRPADAELFERVAVQGALGHDHALPLEQLVDLGDGQAVALEPRHELVTMHSEQPARLAPPVSPVEPARSPVPAPGRSAVPRRQPDRWPSSSAISK